MRKYLIKINPVISYSDAKLYKSEILKFNKNKAGIYSFTNWKLGKSYVGCSKNISQRLRNYYSIPYLERESKRYNSLIYKAILKYGISSFKLDILEYCDPLEKYTREKYYLDNLYLAYNNSKSTVYERFKQSKSSTKLMLKTKLRYTRTKNKIK